MNIRFIAACVLAGLVGQAAQAAAAADAAGLLAKAMDAFAGNQERQTHWNWNIHETRSLLDKAGQVLQTFPSVDSESIIRSDGRRCNAILAWGDGKRPYMVNADPDIRCRDMDAIGTPFRVNALLQSSQVKLQSGSAESITLTISPDKSKLKDRDPAIRCASSIQATVRLDPATFFPDRIAGEVMESGCDQVGQPLNHYSAVRAGPATSSFRKSARFRLEYALQKDRFQNPANSFWICVRQEFDLPWDSRAEYLYYWGRQLAVPSSSSGRRLVKEAQTTTREFGAETQLRFDK